MLDDFTPLAPTDATVSAFHAPNNLLQKVSPFPHNTGLSHRSYLSLLAFYPRYVFWTLRQELSGQTPHDLERFGYINRETTLL